jgi:hypothetical protein
MSRKSIRLSKEQEDQWRREGKLPSDTAPATLQPEAPRVKGDSAWYREKMAELKERDVRLKEDKARRHAQVMAAGLESARVSIDNRPQWQRLRWLRWVVTVTLMVASLMSIGLMALAWWWERVGGR